MKKFKISLFLTALIVSALMLVGCTCVPHEFNWEAYTVIQSAEFINGISRDVTYSSHLSLEHPYTVLRSSDTYIRFYENGTLVFKPLGESEMRGTYTTKNNGLKNTTVFIVLETGEEISATAEGGVMYTSSIMFRYNGALYTFDDESGYSDEEYKRDTDDLIYRLRDEYYAQSRLARASLIYDGEYKLVSEDGRTIALESANNAVYAMRLTSGDQLFELDRLTEGECFVPSNYFNSSPKHTVITIYYIEAARGDLVPLSELFYIPENASDIKSIFVRKQAGCCPVTNYYEEPDDIAYMLEQLKEIKMLKIPSKHVTLDDSDPITVAIKTQDGEYYADITMRGGLVYIDGEYWKPSYWPQYESGR